MLPLLLGLLAAAACNAYTVPIEDTDYSRQICSGMWSSGSTYINVTFDPSSQGELAMVIYEWADVKYLGKETRPDGLLPKTYVCTSAAVNTGLCAKENLGRFILELPDQITVNSTSFWNAHLILPANKNSGGSGDETVAEKSSFWDNPEGNPDLPDDAEEGTTAWRRSSLHTRQGNPNQNPDGDYNYVADQPIQYLVRKTGYYCVAVLPLTVVKGRSEITTRQSSGAPSHPSYTGEVFFRNTFDGRLPSSDYPKVTFYMTMFLLYVVFAGAWGWLCWKHVNELLPIQYYLSGLVGLLVIEMVANWAYYRYLNAHGKGTASTVFLIVVAILDAGRNSMSFFMLLVVSLGLSVVRESLGRTMLRCQILAGLHFIFGILYAVGIVELQLESTSALVLLLFVIPLAFTLSGFLLWIMYSLNSTIAQLKARKQRYKLSMFEKLYRILLLSIVVIAIFFVVSSFTFSGRLAEDYAAKSWRVQWWLLDGWLALLYFAAFVSIAFLWRPSENNRRLMLSEELAQDEEDAEDYDMEALEGRTRGGRDDDDDDATLVGYRSGRRGPDTVGDDQVVFEIGDEEGGSDDEEPNSAKKLRAQRLSGENGRGGEEERQGLMGDEETDHS